MVNDIPTMREVTAGHALLVDFHDIEAVSNALKKILTDSAFVPNCVPRADPCTTVHF